MLWQSGQLKKTKQTTIAISYSVPTIVSGINDVVLSMQKCETIEARSQKTRKTPSTRNSLERTKMPKIHSIRTTKHRYHSPSTNRPLVHQNHPSVPKIISPQLQSTQPHRTNNNALANSQTSPLRKISYPTRPRNQAMLPREQPPPPLAEIAPSESAAASAGDTHLRQSRRRK